MQVLKNMLQKVFNFGQPEKKIKEDEAALKEKLSGANKKALETLSECRSLLRAAEDQRVGKHRAESLITLEKIIEIMEREAL